MGILLSTAVATDRLPLLAADNSSVHAADSARSSEAVPNPPCPDARVPVELSAGALAGLRAGQPQIVSVRLDLDDLGQLAHAEGSVVDTKLTVDPALQQAFQAELELRVQAVLLVAQLPADRVQRAPVISATASLVPAAEGAATAGATVQLYGSVNLRVQSVDEVCRAAHSADVATIAANTTPESFGR